MNNSRACSSQGTTVTGSRPRWAMTAVQVELLPPSSPSAAFIEHQHSENAISFCFEHLLCDACSLIDQQYLFSLYSLNCGKDIEHIHVVTTFTLIIAPKISCQKNSSPKWAYIEENNWTYCCASKRHGLKMTKSSDRLLPSSCCKSSQHRLFTFLKNTKFKNREEQL